MAKGKGFISVSDSIDFKSINTGGQSVGNGGDGYFKGSVSNSPSIKFDPSNKAEGAEVHVKTGDYVSQKASWDADGGDAKAWKHSKAYGGDAKSNGDQSSSSGSDTSKVYADTKAHQSNYLKADMHQEVAAGIGGDGGHGNLALGGDVNVHIDTF
ncbi:hypothetical protein I6F35_02080 [Bradyrhizobium sp. BRP22]|uniref:hypothetical protein n=1 Tax=Bradyrhizobium sp. BRP22 TaxID=2793821 RepID=UPI001CD59B8C|nr:hypothetical protein [Bradyrhizobium sp. BRP22]MCA1452002.1 hypothetical protein [Bradyrhizobium sp. BRP22]